MWLPLFVEHAFPSLPLVRSLTSVSLPQSRRKPQGLQNTMRTAEKVLFTHWVFFLCQPTCMRGHKTVLILTQPVSRRLSRKPIRNKKSSYFSDKPHLGQEHAMTTKKTRDSSKEEEREERAHIRQSTPFPPFPRLEREASFFFFSWEEAGRRHLTHLCVALESLQVPLESDV